MMFFGKKETIAPYRKVSYVTDVHNDDVFTWICFPDRYMHKILSYKDRIDAGPEYSIGYEYMIGIYSLCYLRKKEIEIDLFVGHLLDPPEYINTMVSNFVSGFILKNGPNTKKYFDSCLENVIAATKSDNIGVIINDQR